MKRSLSLHWPAIILALSIGVLMVLPTVLSIRQLGPGNFKGIYPLLSDDEDHYMTMIKEMHDGHAGMSNPYIKELKEGPYTQPSLADRYYSGFASIFNISVGTAALVNDFILPFIAVLLCYFLFFRIIQSRKISLCLTAVFFISFISLFNRPVNPQFSFIFLASGLHVVWTLVQRVQTMKRLYLYTVLFSLIFGILVYVYPFYWMTLAVVYVGLTFCRGWLDSNFSYWVKSWVTFLAIGLMCSIPFFLNFHRLVTNPLFAETTLRNGYVTTYIPGAFFSVAPLFLCALLLLAFKKIYVREGSGEKKWDDIKMLVLGWVLVLGSIILNWQNVITGKTIQFTSHLYPVSALFTLIIIGTSLVTIKNKGSLSSRYSKIIILLSLVLLTSIGYMQKESIGIALKGIYSPVDISSLQDLAAPMEWLDTHAPFDSAIYTLGTEYDWAIPVYTHSNIYFRRHVGIFLIRDSELEDRWAIQHFFDPVDHSLVYGNRDIWLNKFIDTYQSKEIRRHLWERITGKVYPETVLMEESVVDAVLLKYQYFKKEGFEKALKTYSVDYILVDTADPRYADIPQKFKAYKFLELAAQIKNTAIYKVN